MEKTSISREALYDLVWKEPLLTLSKRFNISDVGLRKICNKMNIPLPENGHWQKIKFGKHVERKQLPIDNLVAGSRNFELRDEENKILISESPIKNLCFEIIQSAGDNLVVPGRLNKPHQLITILQKDIASKAPDNYQYKGTVSSSGGVLDVRVSLKSLSRMLRFMDTFIKLIEARGHNIEFRNYQTYLNIEGHEFPIKFREKMRKEVIVERPWNRTVFYPTGVLALISSVCLYREWKDGKLPLEQQMAKIIAELEIAGKKWTALRIEQKRAETLRLEKEREVKENLARIEKEKTDFIKLLNKANRWKKVRDLREYIEEVAERSSSMGELTLELNNWLAWAKDKADWYDPFVEKEDSLMEGMDRDKIWKLIYCTIGIIQ